MRLDLLLRALSSKSGDTGPGLDTTAPLRFYATGEERYRPAYYESAARNVLMLDARDEVAAALSEEGIRPVVFKGADLADSLYPSSALRPMIDVDLLVEREETSRAEQVLAGLGFEPFCPEMTEGLTRRTKHARLYVRGKAAIDLHWSLVRHGIGFPAPDLEWFRAHTVDDGRPFLRFDATAHLLYLVAHMKLHHDNETPSLVALADFYLLSQSESLRWDAFLAEADALGWTAAVAAVVRDVTARLGLSLPAPLQELAEATLPDPLHGPARVLGELSALDLPAKAAFVRGHLFPTAEYMKRRYRPRHRWTLPLYYVVRWARIVRDAASLAARTLVMGWAR